jgi:ComF family protein
MSIRAFAKKQFQSIRVYLQGFVHLLYPHVCLQCAAENLSTEQIICDHCEILLPYTDFAAMQNSPVDKIFWGRIKLHKSISILFYTKKSIVQKILFELKYKQNKKAGILLGKLIAATLKKSIAFDQNTILIPIPISKVSRRKRGYNQTELICASMVTNGFNVPIFKGLLKSKNHTTQTHKDRVQRGIYLDNVFKLTDFNVLTNKDIIIIDDVLTTGATIEAAYHCLLKANPKSISMVTAAYTLD